MQVFSSILFDVFLRFQEVEVDDTKDKHYWTDGRASVSFGLATLQFGFCV